MAHQRLPIAHHLDAAEVSLPAATADWTGLPPAEFARWADPAEEKLLVALGGGSRWIVIKAIRDEPPSCTFEIQAPPARRPPRPGSPRSLQEVDLGEPRSG
jgi:hypothetical protein